MSNKVIFNQLLIADINNQKAKIINFANGKNLLSTSKNHLGKSLICKSLYHALGADAFFSKVWKEGVSAIYSLTFTVNDAEYRITRKDNIFNLYSANGNRIKCYKTKNLIAQLNNIFNFQIMIVVKGNEGNLVESYPVFMYLPYYIDQENGWTPKTESFPNLAMADKTQRTNALYYHLGCLDEDYVQTELKLKQANDVRVEKEKELEQCRSIIEYLMRLLDKNGDVIANEEELAQKINSNKSKINELLTYLEKLRNEIVRLENDKALVEKEKEAVEQFIKNEKKKKIDVNNVTCPKCEHEFAIDFTERFRKQYIVETINNDLSEIIKSIAKISEKLETHNHDFANTRAQLKLLERTISADENLFDLYIKTKSARSMISDSQTKIGALDVEIAELKKEIKAHSDKLKLYDERKKDANARYKNYLDLLFAPSALNISTSEAIANSFNIGDDISVSGAYTERAILAKYYAFLQTKKSMAEGVINFPFVVDSPKSGEQDNDNSKAIMEFILNNTSLDNQIIVATVDGKNFLGQDSNVNIIELTNEPHNLLSKECYSDNSKLITQILLDFAE